MDTPSAAPAQDVGVTTLPSSGKLNRGPIHPQQLHPKAGVRHILYAGPSRSTSGQGEVKNRAPSKIFV